VRHASFVLGMMLSFVAIQVVTSAADPRATAAALVAVVLPFGAAIVLVPPLLLRERPEFLGRGAPSAVGAIRDVLRNPHARLLLLVNSIEMMGAGVLGVISPFLAEYVLERPDLIGPLPAVFVVASIASIPLWIRLARRFGKRDTWLAAMVATAFAFGGMFFVGSGDVTLAVVLLVAAGTAQGCGGTVGPSILADVIDWDEWSTGERKEGAYSAAWGFTLKGAQAVVILLTGWVLQLSGFEPNAEQTPTANLALRSLFAGLPFVCFLVGAALFSRFRLDRREHDRIRADLDRRGAVSGAR
jgi:GPH family glycoside/pentoside/hexuronide:cation symporter